MGGRGEERRRVKRNRKRERERERERESMICGAVNFGQVVFEGLEEGGSAAATAGQVPSLSMQTPVDVCLHMKTILIHGARWKESWREDEGDRYVGH